MEEISGSNGVSASADTLWLLRRDRGQPEGTLHVTGRDVEEEELAVTFEDGMWTSRGAAEHVRKTATKEAICQALGHDEGKE